MPSAARSGIDFADLTRRVVDDQPLRQQIPFPEQETSIVAQRKRRLMAFCMHRQWTLAQILATCRMARPKASAI